jgi:hypothetical protein
MKRLYWFARTGIACMERKELVFDLTPYITIFQTNKLWERTRYRTEYNYRFDETDLQKIKALRVFIHTDIAPLSNLHEYEKVLNRYVPFENISRTKLLSSGLSEVDKLAVFEVDIESTINLTPDLTYEQEKDIDAVFSAMTDKIHDQMYESERVKSIVCDFMQFFVFNLHLNFLTIDYSFHLKDKPNLMGLTVMSKDNVYSSRVDRIDFLSHYILYDKSLDKMDELMRKSAEFWCFKTPSVHFFLEALKGDFISSTNFIQLLFTLESFFANNISNDYITLVVPLLIANNVKEMVRTREIIRRCFMLRNEIVHGNGMFNIHEDKYTRPNTSEVKDMPKVELFFELKNILIKTIYFCLRNNLFLQTDKKKITHELIFKMLPQGIS